MKISRLLGATMVAGAASPDPGQVAGPASAGAKRGRVELQLLDRERHEPRPAPGTGRRLSRVAR
jgi:hypothetical protein